LISILLKNTIVFPEWLCDFLPCIPRIRDDKFRFESTFFGFIKNTKEMILLSYFFIDIPDTNTDIFIYNSCYVSSLKIKRRIIICC
jgi:hypothetical protein